MIARIGGPCLTLNRARRRRRPWDLEIQRRPLTRSGEELGGNSRWLSSQLAYLGRRSRGGPEDGILRTAWAEDVLHRLRHKGGPVLDAVGNALGLSQNGR